MQGATLIQWRLESKLSALLIAVFAAGFVMHGRLVRWPVVDDAGIALAFGRSLFSGDGFRVNAVSQIVEGFSSPLWMLVQGLSLPLQTDGASFSAWVGLGAGALAAIVVGLWAPVAMDRPLRVEDTLATLVVAANPSLVAWCSSGMETGLWILALAASGLALLRAWRRGTPVVAAVLLGLLVWVRPEAPLFVVWAVPLWATASWMSGRSIVREAKLAGGIVLGLGLILVLGRFIFFADWVPNTYWAKRFWGADGSAYVRAFVDAYPWLVGTAFVGCVLGLFQSRLRYAVLLAAAWVFSVAVFARNGDWMGEWRFVVPGVPFLAVLASAGVSAAREFVSRAERSLSIRLGAGALLLAPVSLVVMSCREARIRHDIVKASPQFPLAVVSDFYRSFSSSVAQSGELRPLLGCPDMGGQALELLNAEIIDVAGLCDRAVAIHAQNWPAIEDYMLSEGPPSWIDAHGPSGHVAGFRNLMAHFEKAPGHMWHLRGLTAENDPRCPGSKEQVLSTTTAELVAVLQGDLQRGDGTTAIHRWRCAYAYWSEDKLPPETQRRSLAKDAWELSLKLERDASIEPALRLASFATIVSGHNPHYRRRTEILREKMYPRRVELRR